MDPTINQQLRALLGNEELVSQWWTSPNRAFGLLTPCEVWIEQPQGPERIRQYVSKFLYGDYF